MKTPVKQKRPQPKMNVIDGDVLYFKHPKHGALSGKVNCVGKDGVTVHHEHGEDGLLNVPWDDVLGHKERRVRKLVLIEKGEDGAIAQDEDGNRVFVEGEIPEDEKPLNKSLAIESPVELSLRDRAAIDAALIGAGFEPSLDYIRATYGEHWTKPTNAPLQPVEAQTIDVDELVKAIAEVKAHGDAQLEQFKYDVGYKKKPKSQVNNAAID